MSNNSEKQGLHKSVINWYPGHMVKTKRQILEDLKLIDIVVEILDARIPISSQNPDINQLIKDKKRIVVLNKCDLADDVQNQKWVKTFERKQIPAVLVDSNSGKGIPEVVKKIEQVYAGKEEKFSNKGRIGKSIRVMVLGIPNVGKSSFINRITKKNVATVGNKPGVTRQKQWVRINEEIELLDTPGILWPKFESQEVGLKLAYTGTIKDDVLETIEVGYELLKELLKLHLSLLVDRYKLDINEIKEVMKNKNLEENEKVVEVMEMMGRKRGAIISGGRVDLEKVARMILEEYRSGKIGRITLEIAEDIKEK